jgi:chromosome segregation ATPase
LMKCRPVFLHFALLQALQQQAEGLIAAISRNKQSSTTTQQDLQDLHQQLQEQQAQHATAREYLQQLQEQQQQLQAQMEASEQQLAERERQKQQVAAEVSEKQHALQVTRGECAAVQDKLSQVDGCSCLDCWEGGGRDA